MGRINYIDGNKYELKDGKDTPFKRDSLYVYLNKEMFIPIESVEEFYDILERAGLTDGLKGEELK